VRPGWGGPPAGEGGVGEADIGDGYDAYTSKEDSWPAGQPVFAVNVTRSQRRVVAPKVTVTVLPLSGSNWYAAEPRSR
jgi:hypothetical protein